ncbi:MAG TPA: acyl-CoA dehydrogenase family protein [Acidimicrobiales bacterium]|nr:acyl-CoA dehydrogenase family protein [Acidimicrobiales bacterium]
MQLELSEDQQALQDAVRAVLERESPVSLARRVVEEHKGADELWARLVELDWPALAVPEEHGGLGLGMVELAVVAEQMGMVLAPAPFLSTATQFVPAVVAVGGAEHRERFLGPVVAEGAVGSLAVAEPSGRYAPEDTVTVATPDGDGYVLRGEKHFVLDAELAREFVVSARLPGTTGAAGIGLFVVGAETVAVTPMACLDATRGYGAVRLGDVRVGPERVLGRPGHDGEVVRAVVGQATVALAAEMVGTCQTIFDIVHSYVQEREQFGVKIGSFQAIKHKLANMFVALESARATAYFAAAAIAERDERTPGAVAMAKASVGDCQKLLGTEGIQCLGGIGYTWEHDMHLFVKRAKTGAALFGTGAEHLEALAHILGL